MQRVRIVVEVSVNTCFAEGRSAREAVILMVPSGTIGVTVMLACPLPEVLTLVALRLALPEVTTQSISTPASAMPAISAWTVSGTG